MLRIFASLALARNPLVAFPGRCRVFVSLRKGEKETKGNSHARNSKLLIDSKTSESSRFPQRKTVDDLPTA